MQTSYLLNTDNLITYDHMFWYWSQQSREHKRHTCYCRLWHSQCSCRRTLNNQSVKYNRYKTNIVILQHITQAYLYTISYIYLKCNSSNLNLIVTNTWDHLFVYTFILLHNQYWSYVYLSTFSLFTHAPVLFIENVLIDSYLFFGKLIWLFIN